MCLVEVSRAQEERGLTLSDLLDADAMVCSYAEGLVGPDGDLSEAVEDLIEFGVDRILIVDRIEVLPAFRGRCLGLRAMYRLLDSFAGTGVLPTIQAWPLQFTRDGIQQRGPDDLELGSLPTDRASAFKSIRSYWARVGFQKVAGDGDQELWILNTARQQPKRSEVLGEVYDR